MGRVGWGGEECCLCVVEGKFLINSKRAAVLAKPKTPLVKYHTGTKGDRPVPFLHQK